MNNNNDVITEIIDIIDTHQTFILSTHIFPEGDALGSQLALSEVLENANKQIAMVNAHPVPVRYKFLPNNDKILNLKEYTIMTQGRSKPEVFFLLDCPTIGRIGEVKKIIPQDCILINIDHHPSNSYFAQINYVDDLASSTCQMLFEFFRKLNIKLDTSIAVNLYAGILTDTGGFKYSCTSSKTHRIVSELLQEGVEPCKIFQLLYEQWPVERFKLLAKVLDTIEIEFEGQYAYMILTNDMIKKTGATEELSEDFINYCLCISNIKIAAFFREDAEYIKVTFRSKNNINVNRIASKYGGGGHIKASGCRIKGNLEEVKEKVRKDIKQALSID